MKYRSAVIAGALLVAAVAVYLSLGPPRVLWLNAGLTLAYDRTKGLSALVAATVVAAVAFLAPRRAGQVAALVAAAALTRLLERLLFQIQPTDPLTFSIAPVVLLVGAALASYLPARRGMRIPPVVALRTT